MTGLETVNVPRGAHAFFQPAQAGGILVAGDRCSAPPVVEHRDVQLVGGFVEPHGDHRLRGVRMFGDVRQRLGHDEVRDGLRLVG